MGTRSILLLLVLLLAACAPAAPVSEPLPTAAPASTDTPHLTPAPPAYARSLLLVRWDSETRRHLLAPVDPFSSEPVPGLAAIDLGVNYYHAFSPDRSTLAILSYADDSARNPTLHIVDLSTWREKTHRLEITGWAGALAFSPDSRQLAITALYRERNLLVYDLAADSVIAHIQPEFEIAHLRYTRDGAFLMAYGRVLVERFTENEHSEGPARVTLFDAADLSVTWSAELTGVRDGIYPLDEANSAAIHSPGNGIYYYPGAAFDPLTDRLHIVHADEEKLTTVDFAARSFRTLSVQPKLTWFERLMMLGARTAHAKAASGASRQAVIPPDGEVIYTVGTKSDVSQLPNGDWEYTSEWLGLQAIRIADGALLLDEDIPASGLTLSADGGRLFLQSWNEGSDSLQTMLYDIDGNDITTLIKGASAFPARRVDGSRVLVSNDMLPDVGESTRMAVYDEDGVLLGEWISPTYAYWLTGQ